MREPPMQHKVFETSDWASTQIALEAALVAHDLQSSAIHELRGNFAAQDNNKIHLAALFKDNFPTGQAITLPKQQIFDTAVKLESSAISAKRILI
ncbi:unnamed protein product [Echinostoma caproni]|uniref:DUF2388 domain-containing protein n=1 Tax=Echinostoma caproni TaxID=27848 RepID=A0A183AZF2_9TREM|nr:unnamed protein product [Echinostoma caproni]